MKQYFLMMALTLSVGSMMAQSPKFNDAMTQAIAEMEKDSTFEQFMAVSNKFERIALAEKDQWLPYYYAAYARCIAGFIQTDKSKVDEILDGAQKFADKADTLQPKNSEIILLKAMVLAGRIMVDPMSRGMQYGMQSNMLMTQAMQIDPSNPRSYLMMGQSLFYTPEQFGGGQDRGCAMLQTSREKYSSFQPASALHPNWGEKQLVEMLQQCNASQEIPHNE